jgi:NAD(P)-dependent dehydrogenase (short-subunit alcohol dehydrogenase family)
MWFPGCDSGFGSCLAQKLDAMGFRVFAGCLAPDREGAQLLKKAASDRLRVVAVDVTDEWQVRKALEEVQASIEEGGERHTAINTPIKLSFV